MPSLSMGVYTVRAGTDDHSTHHPHDRDEVYVGVSGKGRLSAGGEEFDVRSGSILYVKAGVEHHFHEVGNMIQRWGWIKDRHEPSDTWRSGDDSILREDY